MLKATTIADSLAEYLNERFAGFGEITPDTDLLAAGILESLTIMDLLGYIEQEYGICFQPEEIVPANFRCIARLSELVFAKQQRLVLA